MKKIITGYVWTPDLKNRMWFSVFVSVQELRLHCGEVPMKEITEVEVREVTHG